MNNSKWFVIWMTIAFGVARFLIHPTEKIGTVNQTYQAFAHVWVGILLGIGWGYFRSLSVVAVPSCSLWKERQHMRDWTCLTWWLATIVIGVEIIAVCLRLLDGV